MSAAAVSMITGAADYWWRHMPAWSWQAFILLGLTWLVVTLDRSRSPAARHRIWLGGLVALALLPGWAAGAGVMPLPQPTAKPIVYLVRFTSPPPIAGSSAPISGREIPQGPSVPSVDASRVWPILLFSVWTAGCLFCVSRLVYSHWRMHRIAGRAGRKITRAADGVRIGYSSEVAGPVLIGLLRPMILLPSDIETWASDEQELAIIRHELAHLERRDHFVNFFHGFLHAVFFFHPMVRYAMRQLSVERELACDDRVLGAGVEATDYADAILRAAERGILQRESIQPAFNSSKRVLERRIHMILNRKQQLSPWSGWRFLTLANVVIVLVAMSCLLVWRSPAKASDRESDALRLSRHAETLALSADSGAALPKEPIHPIARKMSGQFAAQKIPDAVQEQEPPIQMAMLTTQAAAVAPSSGLSGIVYDPSGARIPGVTVRLLNPESQYSVLTNESGIFRFVLQSGQPAVPGLEGVLRTLQGQQVRPTPGRYTVEAALPGFKTYSSTVTLVADVMTEKNIVLSVAGYTARVQVAATSVRRLPAATPAAVPPPPPPAPRDPIRVGGQVVEGLLLFHPDPIYPPSARDSGTEGTVVLQGQISREGTVTALRVANSDAVDPDLARAAIDAVKQWLYKPYMLNGEATAVETAITVGFFLVN